MINRADEGPNDICRAVTIFTPTGRLTFREAINRQHIMMVGHPDEEFGEDKQFCTVLTKKQFDLLTSLGDILDVNEPT